MFDFYQPEISDYCWIKSVMDEAQPMSCEYAPGNLIGWCKYYGAEISLIDGCLVSKIIRNNLFGFPKGNNRLNALKALRDNYELPSFYGLTPEEKELLENEYPGEYSFYPSRNSFDYIYSVKDLSELAGKKYHSKRNHISYFKKNFKWSFEEIGSDNIAECIEMNKKWYSLNVEKDPEGIEAESEVLKLSFDNFGLFGFVGALLRVDGEVIAFTFGEELNETTFVTHFEKAYSHIRGAYPMINMLFASEILSKKYKYVNREDDVGSEGLRKAKLSYYPEILLEKYTAVKI